MAEKLLKERLNMAGGSAVLEGVMMKCRKHYAVAVWSEDGTLQVEEGDAKVLRDRFPILGKPFIRGVVNFVETLRLSYGTLEKSVEMMGVEEEPTRFEKWLEKTFGKSLMDILMVVAGVLGVCLAMGLFILLPTFCTKLVENLAGDLGWWRNVVEGVIKMLIFVGYLWAITLMKDIRRAFEYHGAEHKTIRCFEMGKELTWENIRTCSRFHPRCGTSFIFVILLMSILIYSLPFVTWDSIWIRFLTKIALFPVLIGICYELLMFTGSHDGPFVRMLAAPGMLMQHLTTREPDEKQVQAAVAALKASLPKGFLGEEEEPALCCEAEEDTAAVPQEEAADGAEEKSEEHADE